MLRVGFVSLCESEILMRFWLSNQVGLWYNLQLSLGFLREWGLNTFQTKLDCGIICNIKAKVTVSQANRFQTKLDCGIICNWLNLVSL